MNLIANQLELSGGTRRDRGECLLEAEQTIPPPVIQKRGALYILTETETMVAGQPRPGDIDLCREAQEIILHEYYNSSVTATITSSLRHALEKANQALFNRNSAVLPPERRGLGITLALIRGGELYTAQLPPTQAYLIHQDEIRYLPNPTDPAQGRPTGPRPVVARTGTDAQATLPQPRAQSVPSLGRYSSIEPNLTRNVFEDGDLLVLCSSQFAQALHHEDVEWVLHKQDSRSALLNLSEFARNKGIADGYALTIGARPDLLSRNQPTSRRDDNGLRNTAEGVAGAVSLFASRFNPRSGRPQEETRPTSASNFSFDDPAPASPRRETEVGRTWNESEFMAQPTTTGPTIEPANDDPLAPLINNRDNDPWLHREDDDLNKPAYLRGRSISPDPGLNNPPPDARNFKDQQAGTFRPSSVRRNFIFNETASKDPAIGPASSPTNFPEPEPEAPAWGTPPAATKTRWRNRGRSSTQSRLETNPADTPYVDMVGSDNPPARRALPFSLSGRGRSLILLGIGLALAFAVLLLMLSVAGGKLSGDNGKATTFVRQAEQKRTTAQQFAATDPTRARKLIVDAQTDLDAARKEKPDLGDIQTVQKTLKSTLDNINRVVVPTDLRMAMDLSNQGSGVRLSKALLSPTADSLYLLDTGRGAVYTGDVLGAVKTILKSGDKSGSATFGKPVAMVARPDGVMVVDDGNLVWLYNKATGSWTAQTLGGASTWGSKAIRLSSSYQGNLYLLGPIPGQVLKYNAGSYPNPPEEWLNPGLAPNLGLDTAAGLSIDGTIYVLTKDGKALQLARPNGKTKGEVIQQFDLKAGDRLGPALSSPASLNVGSLDFPYFFVLDSEKRVMQFRKEDGAFVQQFQAATGRNEFDNLQDVAIDEVNKKLYIIGLQKVYVFNLPDVPGGSLSAQPGLTPDPSAAVTPGAANNVVVISGNPSPTSRP